MAYNGYTNKETWSVCLILDNEQELQKRAQEIANSNKLGIHKDTEFINFVRDLSEFDSQRGMAAELIQAALNEVNWKEVVDHFEEEEFEADSNLGLDEDEEDEE